MSSPDTARPAAKSHGSGIVRMGRAWRSLPPDRRLAAGAALGLFLTLFLPWYQETGEVAAADKVRTATASLTGWAAFSWVEAAVLLVALSTLGLLFLRAEGRAFHLPGGDGFIVMAAGGWTCLLVIWRIFDKQGVTNRGQFATTAGIEWGIFIALAVAAMLAYAGSRIRAAHQPEPLLPGETPEPGAPRARRDAAGAPPRRGASVERREPGRRAAEGARPARRATWAEPVTWDDPAGVADASGAAEGAAEGARPAPDDAQLTIPLDE